MADAVTLKVFVSWSGSTSKKVAAALRAWLPTLSDYFQPFMSDEDIEPGSRGLNTIAEALVDTDFGIIVVTQDNQNRPWLNFEAGALSKEVGPDPRARVVPLLVDFDESSTLSGDSPMVQFQYRHLRMEDMRDVVKTMARAAGVEEVNVLARFDWAWGGFQAELDAVLAEIAATEAATSTAEPTSTHATSIDSNSEVLAEILENTRELVRRSDPPRAVKARLHSASVMGAPVRGFKVQNAKQVQQDLRDLLQEHGFDVSTVQFRIGDKDSDSPVEALVYLNAMPDENLREIARREVIEKLDVFPTFKRSKSAVLDAGPQGYIEPKDA